MSLSIEVYDRSNNRVQDPGTELSRARELVITTQYPGGRCGECSFFVPRETLRPWGFMQGHRLVVRGGQEQVWEGEITGIAAVVGRGGGQTGNRVTARGFWVTRVMGVTLNRRYVDARVDETTWPWDTTSTGAEMASVDRRNRLRFTPKAVAWAIGNGCQVVYTAPTGELIQRVEFDYDLQEGAQNWELGLYNVDTATVEWSVAASGSGSISGAAGDLATPANSITFYFYSGANQTPAADGTIYGQISNLLVYARTANSGNLADEMDEITKDLVQTFSAAFDSDLTGIATPAVPLSLTPFITAEDETLADILMRATEKGDGTQNRWAAWVDLSERAVTPNGQPRMRLEQIPALTDYEYIVDWDSTELVGDLEMDWNLDELANYVVVTYRDPEGKQHRISPADDASLTDSASATRYGGRYYPLDIGDGTAALALSAGQSWLAAYRNPRWQMLSPIQIRGYVKTKQGTQIRAYNVRAGERIKIGKYLDDGTGTWMTFLISATSYDAESDTVSITIGTPLAPLLPGYTHPVTWDDERDSALSSAAGAGGNKISWWKRAKEVGYTGSKSQWDSQRWTEKKSWQEKWKNDKKARG
jgi:hypothetical protein